MMKMECTCAQGGHSAPIETIEMSSGAIQKLPEILKDYSHICIVSDENTYEVAGKRAETLLKAAGKKIDTCVLPAGALASAESVGTLLIEVGKCPDPYDIEGENLLPEYILAVGGGSVNDVSRMVAYRLGLPYGVCGTAPSMDGYVSVVAPLLVRNKKIVYTCTTARHVIIDLDICAEAPERLLFAGIGDMIGKSVAILDWELSKMLTGEYYCEKTARMVLEAADLCTQKAFNITKRDPEDIKAIAGGLITSGLGIAYTGSSRPASGTEHMIGQTWEVIGLELGHAPQLHGIEVGQATFTAILMYKRLYETTEDERIKALVAPYLPAFDKVIELQKSIHIPFAVHDKQEFLDGIYRGRTFRERYTLLQYLYDRGLLEEYAEYSFDATMALE